MLYGPDSIGLCWTVRVDRDHFEFLEEGKERYGMAEVFEIFVTGRFAAAHSLRGHPGPCARAHGHNWEVELVVRCSRLDDRGLGVDFADLQQALQEVLGSLDHTDLNQLTAFCHDNPSAENIARYLFQELSPRLASESLRVARVVVRETAGAGVRYWVE
jgi:6-pyruvoyltetrahydropterin/6-carboxytetrahydropterin synthase